MARIFTSFWIFHLLLLIHTSQAQDFRVCGSVKRTSECQSVERGDSNVACTEVIDSSDCLIKMEENKADFSLFTAEEVLLAATKNPDNFQVLASVKAEEKQYQNFAYQAVVLVKNNHVGGLDGLKGGKLCHPGYGTAKEQMWSNRVLQYFEKKTASVSRRCDKSMTSFAESDAADLSNYFSEACRPGPWVSDPVEDKRLKDKYPTLCTLCTSNNSPDCDGYRYYEPRAVSGAGVNSHLSAIECLVSGKGTVAYVAYQHIQEYFKSNSSEMLGYSLLCEDGTLAPLSNSGSNNATCAWISQHWGALVARRDKSVDLLKKMKVWMEGGRAKDDGSWVKSLEVILFQDTSDIFVFSNSPTPLKDYVTPGRPVPAIAVDPCHKPLKWCTINDMEKKKCEWIKASASSLGLQPDIECVQAISYIDCMSQIQSKRADFVSIDSNLGFLARKHYNLTSIMYHETSKSMASKVFAFIKDSSSSSITRFENLRGKNACFPEYGGIGWVAFMRTAHERRVISTHECDYGYEVVNFFGKSCAPGAADPAHYPTQAADATKLCSACPLNSPREGANEQGIVSPQMAVYPSPPQTCPAEPEYIYYGNRGALRCLNEMENHVAFIEGQNLKQHAQNVSIKPENFRALCRNNTLSTRVGFDLDDGCALSVTIDSEIIIRRGFEDKLNLQLLLQELDSIFGYTSNFKLVDLKIFSPFNGIKDLLFKDSTTGLATRTSENQLVRNYIELFKHTEACTGAATTVTLSLTLLFVSVAMLIMQRS